MGKKSIIVAKRIPRVMAVISMRGSFGAEVMRGVFAHLAGTSDWGIEIVRTASEFTPETVRAALAHRVDGFIIAVNEGEDDAFALLAASSVPFVTVETYIPALDERRSNVAHVSIDNTDIGREAARSFLAQGRFATFAFVPQTQKPDALQYKWSRLREESFREILARRRLSCVTFAPPPEACADSVSMRGHLARWLRKLTPPVALLAAHDSTAHDVLQACKAARLGVPNAIAILGVDNETLICENTVPSLSSIQPDFEGAGRLAAEVLDEMMCRRGGGTSPVKTVLAPGKCKTVLRASTSRETIGGPLVQKALAFIARNAKNGISARDVVAHLKVSRALVDLRFREVRGVSLLNTILDVRLAELKRMLRETDDPIESITRRLGWSSPNYPKNLFKKRTGMSMQAYRMSSR